ncbi:MAG: hypothetical protein KKA64_03320 [Nanoarchaeota archaeon]|nr:hypothetical protein [Nanoarchaeota archaeon]
MRKYKPNYDLKEIPDEITPTGLTARENAEIEEETQRAIAESTEWLLAKNHKSSCRESDSMPALKKLGFKILGEANDLFYNVQPPEGWTKSTQGYDTIVKDGKGRTHITQFFKGAFYDRDAFLCIGAPYIYPWVKTKIDDPGFIKDYNQFQNKLKDTFGIETKNLENVINDCIINGLHEQLVTGVRDRIYESLKTEKEDNYEIFREFIFDSLTPIYKLFDKGKLRTEEIIPEILNVFEEKNPSSQKRKKSIVTMKKYKAQIAELKEYTEFVANKFLNALEGDPAEANTLDKIIEQFRKEKKYYEMLTVPDSIEENDNYISCKDSNGNLTYRGQQIQEQIEKGTKFYQNIFDVLEPRLKDNKTPYGTRVINAYEALINSGIEGLNVERLNKLKKEYKQEIKDGFSTSIYFRESYFLPSGLKIDFHSRLNGNYLIKDGVGIIVKRNEGNYPPQLWVRASDKRSLKKQLTDMDKVEEIAQETIGKYLSEYR